ncbi:hypothetical protein [Cytobacillus firmus]|uniref:hypothetical protein n=1 Tax=Cytobacillus firmus TaxID=1399 RepID=UPI0018CC7EC5|nr:hypothetical protein [Cytobacillus firmus]MBG9654183.1 hypothetical protein [Cytobacillus firmus]MED1909055.1 hypothetical protein [Cytobacillus firmus]
MKKVSLLFSLMLIFSFNGISASAASKEDALTAVVNFLKAQKSCDAEKMMNNSEYFLKVDNVKEMYTSYCRQNQLQHAKITDISLINEDTALVSIQSTYKNMVNIRTAPVIKKDGQWKVVIGVPPSGVKSRKERNPTGKEAEIEQFFKDYTTAIKAKDIQKMKTFVKIVRDSSKEKIDNHLEALTQQPTPEVITYGINIISENLAIAQTEIKYPNHSYMQNLSVMNENGQWKLIFGHPLTNSIIPKTGNSIDVK